MRYEATVAFLTDVQRRFWRHGAVNNRQSGAIFPYVTDGRFHKTALVGTWQTDMHNVNFVRQVLVFDEIHFLFLDVVTVSIEFSTFVQEIENGTSNFSQTDY
jgi:hypothetical protein